MSGSILRFDEFELDPGDFQLRCSGETVHLQKVPLEILLLLAEREGRLVTREEIVERIWGKDVFLDVDSAVSTAVRKIRLALGDDSAEPKYIETVPGKGYPAVPPRNFDARMAEYAACFLLRLHESVRLDPRIVVDQDRDSRVQLILGACTRHSAKEKGSQR